MSKDFLDRTIAAGDTVVYPVRRGSAMWLTKLVVTQVADDHITGYHGDSRRVTVKNLNNCIVIESKGAATVPAPTV